MNTVNLDAIIIYVKGMNNLKRLLITLLPPAAVFIIFLMKDFIYSIINNLPQCQFHKMTGLLCPGCGNTRALKSLLSLNIIDALRYNITLPLIIAALILFYIQSVISIWHGPVILFPKKISVYIVLCILLVFYFIIRNFINFMP